MKGVVAAGLAVGLAAAIVGTAILASAASLLGVGSGAPVASSTATPRIHSAMLALYQEAAITCPGLPWTILAAIGTVESDNGQSTLPGVHAGANPGGHAGADQFEPGDVRGLRRAGPSSQSGTAQPLRPGRCRLRGGPAPVRQRRGGGGAPRRLRCTPTTTPPRTWPRCWPWRSRLAERRPMIRGPRVSDDYLPAPWRCQWALAQIGTPYVWGGEKPWCRVRLLGPRPGRVPPAGVSLPRVAQDQYDATRKLAPGTPASPPVISSSSAAVRVASTASSLFVGIVGGRDVMVDAPYTGAAVRADAFPSHAGHVLREFAVCRGDATDLMV